MKAFEVKQKIIGGYDGETRTIFAEAKTKKEVLGARDVTKAFIRKDIKPNECPFYMKENLLVPKEGFEYKY